LDELYPGLGSVFGRTCGTAAFALACALPAHAQQQAAYPLKPLKMIMSFPAGGPTDILGRIVGQKLTEGWGQNVIIDNRPGGAGMIGANLAAKAPPDGYTLFLAGITTLAIAPFVHKNMQYDPLRDFQPVTQTTLGPLLLMTHPSLPAKTVKEFIALAKAKPGQINYASSGPGGSGHLAGELFKFVTGTSLVHVPYRGAPPALIDLMSGQVQSMFGSMLAAVPHIRGGKLRAIAVTGPKRSVALPEVPTFADNGLADYDASSWNGIVVPAGTPRPIVDKLSLEIARIVNLPGVLDRLAGDGTMPVGNTPEQFVAYIKSEQSKWSKVVRLANITIE
jgi:tripartite-type tricarboxylate transporter receptor subunit TctC